MPKTIAVEKVQLARLELDLSQLVSKAEQVNYPVADVLELAAALKVGKRMLKVERPLAVLAQIRATQSAKDRLETAMRRRA